MNKKLLCTLAITAAGILNADLSSRVGSGNFDTGNGDGMTTANQNKLDALNAYNAGYARYGIYRNDYWRNNAPFFTIDDQLLQAHSQGIKAMVSFNWKPSSGLDIGDYNMWYDIGQAYANRYAPGGTLWDNNNISNFGVTVFAAFNEPDWDSQYQQPYHDALEGLADGIHSVSSSLKVTPAGWHSADLFGDYTQYGFGSAIVDLFNDGTLDGIDLHVYSTNDGGGGQLSWRWSKESGQAIFDRTKDELGITRDINFYCTEYNVRDRQDYVPSEDEPHLASRLLTAFWDKAGVVGNNGQCVSQFAMVFVLFDDAPDDQFSCAYDLSPLNLKKRGEAVKLATTLAQGMEFTYLDPHNEGLYVLEDGYKKMWVWQNVPGWTNCEGTSYTLTDIPGGADNVTVYGWDGLRKTVSTNGQRTLTINNLNEMETYMFVAEGDGSSSVPSAFAEAENASVSNGSTKNTSTASNGKYVDGSSGFNIEWLADSPTSENVYCEFRIEVPSSTRSMGVYINNSKVDTFTCSSTSWEIHSPGLVSFDSGINSIELRDSEGTAEFNVDYFAMALDAENTSFSSGTVKNNSNASGGKYVDGSSGMNVIWEAAVPDSRNYELKFRIKVPSRTRSMGVYVNNSKKGVITSSSTSWETQTIGSVNLSEGTNTIELRDSEGTDEFDVDYLILEPTDN